MPNGIVQCGRSNGEVRGALTFVCSHQAETWGWSVGKRCLTEKVLPFLNESVS